MNGDSLESYAIRAPIATVITSFEYEETQARIAYGLTEDAYQALPGAPCWCIGEQKSKSHVVVWYRKNQRIEAVMNDMQAREMERKSKMRHR